jgi:hypothetical protein
MVYSFSSFKFYVRCWQPFENWPLIECVKGFQTFEKPARGLLAHAFGILLYFTLFMKKFINNVKSQGGAKNLL